MRIDQPALGNWTAWVPTITTQGGALESTTIGHARYVKNGKTVSFTFSIRCKNDGTGTATGYVQFTLPLTPSNVAVGAGYGSVDQHMLQGVISTSGYVRAYRTNAVSPVRNSADSANVDTFIQISGTYETAS